MQKKTGIALAKRSSSSWSGTAVSPLLDVHAKNLLWHAHLNPEALADPKALRAVVWDAELYQALSEGKSYAGDAVVVLETPQSICWVASAIEHLRANVFPRHGDDHAASVRHLATVASKPGSRMRLKDPIVGHDALVILANAIAAVRPDRPAIASIIREVGVNVSLRLAGREKKLLLEPLTPEERKRAKKGKKKEKDNNLEVQMLLHYLTRSIFEIGMTPDPAAVESAEFPLNPAAHYILSDPGWERLAQRQADRESLAQVINRSIVTRGGARHDWEGRVPTISAAMLVGVDKKKRRRLEEAKDLTCLILVERAKRAAEIGRTQGLRAGKSEAQFLALKDVMVSRPGIVPIGKGQRILDRILRPLCVGFIMAFDGVARPMRLAGGREILRQVPGRAFMSLKEMKAVRLDFVQTAAALGQMMIPGVVEKLTLGQAYELIAAGDGKDGTYILMATYDPDIALEDRIWRVEGKGTCRSLSGQAHDMVENHSPHELVRMVRKSDGRVLAASGRAFAQHVGNNVLLVVYS